MGDLGRVSSHARAADLTETQDSLDRRSYGSRLRYECGLARMFWDPEEEILYQDRMLQCNWNQSWTRWDRCTDSIKLIESFNKNHCSVWTSVCGRTAWTRPSSPQRPGWR